MIFHIFLNEGNTVCEMHRPITYDFFGKEKLITFWIIQIFACQEQS
jgi:hypothetical protein